MINSMNTKEENIVDNFKRIYNSLKNHPYVNEITIKNGISFHDIYSEVYKYTFGDGSKPYRISVTKRTYTIPELVLLTIETHDINMMYGALRDYHTDGDDFNIMHHKYMMELLEVVGSLAGELPKKEYINTYMYVRYGENEWKWNSYLYTVKEINPGEFGRINCICESYIPKLIEKYNKTIEYYKEKCKDNYVSYCKEELEDVEKRTGIYHIVISDEDWKKYAEEKR